MKIYLRLNRSQTAQLWIGKKVSSPCINTKRISS